VNALESNAFDDFAAALVFAAGPTAAIVAGTGMLLGASAGLVGTFAVLRRRALVTDALGHATLPGVVLAFMALTAFGLDPRQPLALTLGAALSALVALGALQALRRRGVDGDAATSAVLCGSFGLGLALLGVVQGLALPRANGLDHLLLGQMAAARRSDLLWLGAVAAASLVLVVGARHRLAAVAFDEEHARLLGLDVRRYDTLLLGLLFAVTVSALPVVGAVLVVALVVLPAAAARCWSDRLPLVLLLSALFGAGAAQVGTALSFALPDAPTGAVVVLVAGALFAVSLLVAPRRGLVAAWLRRARDLAARRERALLAELAARADGVHGRALSRSEHGAAMRLVRRGALRRVGERFLAEGPR
jgi:manganese/zinc/iron transport system permease protein